MNLTELKTLRKELRELSENYVSRLHRTRGELKWLLTARDRASFARVTEDKFAAEVGLHKTLNERRLRAEENYIEWRDGLLAARAEIQAATKPLLEELKASENAEWVACVEKHLNASSYEGGIWPDPPKYGKGKHGWRMMESELFIREMIGDDLFNQEEMRNVSDENLREQDPLIYEWFEEYATADPVDQGGVLYQCPDLLAMFARRVTTSMEVVIANEILWNYKRVEGVSSRAGFRLEAHVLRELEVKQFAPVITLAENHGWTPRVLKSVLGRESYRKVLTKSRQERNLRRALADREYKRFVTLKAENVDLEFRLYRTEEGEPDDAAPRSELSGSLSEYFPVSRRTCPSRGSDFNGQSALLLAFTKSRGIEGLKDLPVGYVRVSCVSRTEFRFAAADGGKTGAILDLKALINASGAELDLAVCDQLDDLAQVELPRRVNVSVSMVWSPLTEDLFTDHDLDAASMTLLEYPHQSASATANDLPAGNQDRLFGLEETLRDDSTAQVMRDAVQYFLKDTTRKRLAKCCGFVKQVVIDPWEEDKRPASVRVQFAYRALVDDIMSAWGWWGDPSINAGPFVNQLMDGNEHAFVLLDFMLMNSHRNLNDHGYVDDKYGFHSRCMGMAKTLILDALISEFATRDLHGRQFADTVYKYLLSIRQADKRKRSLVKRYGRTNMARIRGAAASEMAATKLREQLVGWESLNKYA